MDSSPQDRTTNWIARLAAAMLVCALAAGSAIAQSPHLPPAPDPDPSAPRDAHEVVLTLAADGRLFVGNERTADNDLEDKLLEIANRDDRIFLRADKRSRYDRVMHVMNVLRRGGFTKVALVAWDGR